MHAPSLLTPSLTPLAEWEIKSQIQQVLNNKFTGQIRVTFLNGRTESIFVQHGTVQTIYIRNHRVPDLNWRTPVIRFGRGTLEIDPLPSRALMFRKVVTEEIMPPAYQPATTNQLRVMFSLAEHNPNPTLFHIHWDRAEAFVLVAGGHISIRHAVFITPAQVNEGNEALDNITTWTEPRCTITIHRGDIQNQAWLEVHLNILLEWYCQSMMKQYQQLTGAIMVKSILQSLLVLAENQGWQLSIHNQQLQDTSIFMNATDTGNAYREMLRIVQSRIEPIVGSSLANYLMKQSVETTRGVYGTIQEVFGLLKEAQ